jgi:hypothetical protein
MLTKTQSAAMLVFTTNTYTGKERDKYLLHNYRELRVGATQWQVKEKSTRELAR